jgi:nucleoside-diphosphate-sugar epimerase
MGKTVLVLGAAGKFGGHAARAFAGAGWEVRRFRRGTDMTAAAMGADVIVNGLNPPNYHDWAQQLPAITADVIAAAQASGATVILPGNVYNFGDVGGVWSEHTPQQPVSRKGQLRVALEAAYRASGVPTIILRAGNVIDPDARDDVMGLVFLRGIKRGRITAPGGVDVLQAYAYAPDWARAAVMLAERRDSLPVFADIPFPGHAFTVTELRDALQRLLGRPLRITGVPWWALRFLSPVWELARELGEMRYLWNTSHALSGETFNRLIPGFRVTPLDEVLRGALPPEIRPDKTVRTGIRELIGAEGG